MLKRLIKGEPEYHGLWREKTSQDFDRELEEEIVDAHNYSAMKRYKIRHDIQPAVAAPTTDVIEYRHSIGMHEYTIVDGCTYCDQIHKRNNTPIGTLTNSP